MKSLIKLLFFLIFPLILNSCGNLVESNEIYNAGTLVLTLSTPDNRTITPDTDMVITDYTIDGIGPNSKTFSVSQSSDSPVFIQDDLRVGDWTITVDAFNAAAENIGSGTVDVTINQLTSVTADVSIEPIEGTGNMTCCVTYSTDDFIVTPVITFELIPQESITAYITGDLSSVVLLTSTIEQTDTVVTIQGNIDLNNDYYLLVITVKDEGITIWSQNDIVRVVTDEITEVSYTLTPEEINQLEGSLGINITENMYEPLTVELDFDLSTLNNPAPKTTAKFVTQTEEISPTYTWILDNVLLTNIESTIILENLEPNRVYQLTVMITEAGQIGSTSISFTGSQWYYMAYPTPSVVE